MGYLHITNLYKKEGQDILLFKECYAMEKVHGTSSFLAWNKNTIEYSAGGEKPERFKALFNESNLTEKFIQLGYNERNVTVYGEGYGGSQQKMSDTYGKELKFIAFDVCLDDKTWLNVPDAENFCKELGIEFVHYVKISTDIKEIDAQRDAYSVQAVRNGITEPKKREGVVLRPLNEFVNSFGERIICKHKGDDFRETATPRKVDKPQEVLNNASLIADEYVTEMRLEHVLDKIPNHGMDKMNIILNAMVEDVIREAKGEIIVDDFVRKEIRNKTVKIYKQYLNGKITQ